MNGERGMMNSRKQNAPSLLRLLSAFLVRDFFTETSYRFAFLMGLGSILFRTFIFYFLSQFIGGSTAPLLTEYNGDYFSFVLIGLALGGYFGVGLSGFASALREAQNYVRAYTRGLGIFELPEYLAWPDWDEWEPLTAWLKSKRSQP